MAETGGDKTEKATPRKKEKTRKEGQVANSKELSSVAVLLAALLVFYFGAGWMMDNIKETTQSIFVMIGKFEIGPNSLLPLAKETTWMAFKSIAPLMLTILIAGVSISIAQVGLNFSWKPVTPSFDKISPIKGFKKLFSLRSLVELIKSIFKIILISAIAYNVIAGSFSELISMGLLSTSDIMALTGKIALRILWNTTLALILLALLDLFYQRYDHEKKIKMTKQEVKDEHKNYDGNPQIKSRQRAVQREMAYRRMMNDVPDADVILTNPTHVAVAIKYDAEKYDAPLVVAKGAGFIAKNIRQKAIEFGVPILERPPLARQLYRAVKVGTAIPNDLYEAVAEILAYIYNLKGRQAR